MMKALHVSVVTLALCAPATAQQHDHSQHDHSQHTQPAKEAQDHSSHTNVKVAVPELPILAGADPSVETIPAGPMLTVEDFEAKVVTTSPALARARAAIDAVRGRAVQAGLMPNPTAGYSAEEIRSGEPAHGGAHGFSIDQTIPLGGKLGKRRNAVLGEVREAEARLTIVEAAARNSARLAFFDALAAQQRVDLERRMVSLLQEAVRTSYGLFNVGQADKPDVLEIEIEARQAQVRLISARAAMDRAREQLKILAADPSLSFGRIEGTLESSIQVVEAAMLSDILERSPEIATARAALERAELSIRAARAERYPDLIVMGGARYNREHRELDGFHDGRVGWQGFLEAGVTVPIFDRNQGGIATAEAELRAAKAELRALEIGIRSRFNVAFSLYRDSVRISEAYRNEIIPRAEQAYQLYLEKYREMMAAYPQVLIARRTWLQANLEYVAALEEVVRASVPLRGFLIETPNTGE